MASGFILGRTNRQTTATYAIASDYSGVIATEDGFGSFATELQALDSLVNRLEAERAKTAANMARAKARRRYLVQKSTQP